MLDYTESSDKAPFSSKISYLPPKITPRWFDENPATSFINIYMNNHSPLESTSGNCLEKDAKVEYEEVFDDRRAVHKYTLSSASTELRARAGNSTAPSRSPAASRRSATTSAAATTADDRRDRGYDRRGYDDRDRASCGVSWLFARLIFCAGVERYRPRDRYDDRRGRDDYDRRDRGRDDHDRRDRGRDDYDRRDRGG